MTKKVPAHSRRELFCATLRERNVFTVAKGSLILDTAFFSSWGHLIAVSLLSIVLVDLAEFLSLAWHQESPVFRKGQFFAFCENLRERNDSKWIVFKEDGPVRYWLQVVIKYPLFCFFLDRFYYHYGWSFEFVVMTLLFLSFYVALVSDLSWREIPHEINHFLVLLAVLNVIFGGNSVVNLLLGLIPALILLATAMIMYFLRPRIGFGVGGGDLRFIASTGMLMGFSFASVLLTLGSFVAIVTHIAALWKNLKTGKTTHIPMMIGFMAAYLVMLWTHYFAPIDSDLLPMLSLFTNIG